jgi:hypothetical protein
MIVSRTSLSYKADADSRIPEGPLLWRRWSSGPTGDPLLPAGGVPPGGVMRRYERGPDGSWHDGLLMDLLPEDLR